MEDGSCSIDDNKWRHRDDTTIINYYLYVNKFLDSIWQNTIQVFFDLWLFRREFWFWQYDVIITSITSLGQSSYT